MKTRYINYYSIKNTATGCRYSINIWDDVLKQSTFLNDKLFTPEELKHW